MKVICTAVLCQTEKFNFAIDLNNQNATGFQYDHGWSVCTVLGFFEKKLWTHQYEINKSYAAVVVAS